MQNYNNSYSSNYSMDDYTGRGRRNRVARHDNGTSPGQSYWEVVDENKQLKSQIQELDKQLMICQAAVEKTEENLMEAKSKCAHLQKENYLLKTTAAASGKSSVGSTERKDEGPVGFNAAMARLEAKINNKRDQKSSCSVDYKNKLDQLELKLEEEQVKNENLREDNANLNDQLQNYHAIVMCYKKKFKSTVKAAEGEMKFLEGLVSAMLDDDGGDVHCTKFKSESNLSDVGTECSHNSSSTIMTSVSTRPNKKHLPPPPVVLDAIKLISVEDLEELQRMDILGLD